MSVMTTASIPPSISERRYQRLATTSRGLELASGRPIEQNVAQVGDEPGRFGPLTMPGA
jgi:hypothetical protein